MCDKNKLKKITDDVVKAVLSVTSKVDSIILDYNRMRNTLFYQNVARDGIELYGRDNCPAVL